MKALIRFVMMPLLVFGELSFLDLGNAGGVQYTYESGKLLKVQRLSQEGEELYSHDYIYDETGRLVAENLILGLGTIEYNERGGAQSAYGSESFEYDAQGNIVRHTLDGMEAQYEYTEENHLITNTPNVNYIYNTKGFLQCLEDENFFYDESGNLICFTSSDHEIYYEYDDLGRRISKTCNGKRESFGFLGTNEIAIFGENESLSMLRILGLSTNKHFVRAIAIETKDAIYAPIHDFQGNIIKLINADTKEVIHLSKPGPYGTRLDHNSPIPWIFSGKHFDAKSGLVNFGSRYYSPILHKWISNDPACQSIDLHEFCLNNPMSFYDPDGEWAFAIPIIFSGISWAQVVIGGAVIALVDVGVNKAVDWWNNGTKAQQRIELEEQRRRYEERLTQTDQRLQEEYAKRLEQIPPTDYSLTKLDYGKKGEVDESLPSSDKELIKDPNWEDISHPQEVKNGRRVFKEKNSGEVLEFDKGKHGETGHKGRPHFHRRNPNSTGKRDKYLDSQGNPVPDKSDASHLYPKQPNT